MQIPGHIDPVVTPRAITQRSDGRIDLMGLSHLQIKQLFLESQLDDKAAKLRSKQVFHWIYHRGVTDFEMMTDIAKTMRPWLAQRFVIGRPEVIEAQVSSDGTRKWLLRTDDAQDYEMVFIPDADRGTLCISSQVGCTLNCRFCHTGTMRLVRNLTPGEIVGQVMLARDTLGEWPKGNMAGFGEDEDEDDDAGHYTADGRMLTNIVLMGMGEPLYNFDNVRDALKVVMHGDGLALSKRRITLSTSGVVPMMEKAGEEIGVNLAVSLHAVNKEIRDEIVPLNRKYGIEELLQACADYPGANNARRITFEYVMLKDKNDSDDDARELVRLIKQYKLPAKVNLIPFNPWPGAPYECSTPERIRAFSSLIFQNGISAPVRTPRGRDIMAACGQLKSASEEEKPGRTGSAFRREAGGARLMAFTWWRYPTRRFSVDGLKFTVSSKARSDGLHSSLSLLDVPQDADSTPLLGAEAIRNHKLTASLPDGRLVEVELGYVGAWTTGIVARLNGAIVYESHPGQTPAYPEKYRADTVAQSSFKDALNNASPGKSNPFATGAFAKQNRLPLAIDILTGLLFFAIAKMTDLQTAALVGIGVGFGLVLFQYLTKIDVTGGLALFGIAMLCISAGLAWFLADEEWIKLRGTITGLIAATFFLIDGWRGGPYIGRGLARYMPYSDIDVGRMAIGMGLVGLLMAALNYIVAKLASTDVWLFYKTFVDFAIVMALVMLVVRFARRPA